MKDTDLDDLIDRELSRLPSPVAPETLLPRVMRAVGATESSPARGWFTWPLAWQVASLSFMVIGLVGAARLWPIAMETVGLAMGRSATDVTARMPATVERIAAITAAAGMVWTVVQPVVSAMVLLLSVMCGACAVFGAALRNVVLGGTSR